MSASIGFSPVPSSFQRERGEHSLPDINLAQNRPEAIIFNAPPPWRQKAAAARQCVHVHQPTPLIPNMTGNISPPDPSSNTRPCRPSRRGTTLVFDVPLHANTFDTANSSSGRLRVSLRPVLSVSIPFRILYFCPCAFLTAERTAAGDTNSTPSEIEQANGQ
jgi:hypothetical protein